MPVYVLYRPRVLLRPPMFATDNIYLQFRNGKHNLNKVNKFIPAVQNLFDISNDRQN